MYELKLALQTCIEDVMRMIRVIFCLLLLTLALPVVGSGPTRTVIGKVTLKAGSDAGYDLRGCEGFVKGPDLGLRRSVAVGRDGAFRIPELPAGVFDLYLDAAGGQDSNAEYQTSSTKGLPHQAAAAKGGSLARVRCRFEIPPIAAAEAAEPLDLGAFEIDIPPLMTGKTQAPAFKCATESGDEFALAGVKGKYVLVEFWASWCGFCRAELPYMKQINQEFGKDPRFVLISLSLDRDLAAAEQFVAKNEIKWPVGVLGDWAKDKVSLLYGVREIPTMFLIAPDGRIIDKRNSGKEMRDSVARALGK